MWRAYQSPCSGTACGPQWDQMPSLASRNHSGQRQAASPSGEPAKASDIPELAERRGEEIKVPVGGRGLPAADGIRADDDAGEGDAQECFQPFERLLLLEDEVLEP